MNMRRLLPWRSGAISWTPVPSRTQQVVGDDAFDYVVVAEAEVDREAVEFGAAEVGFAFGLEIVGESRTK